MKICEKCGNTFFTRCLVCEKLKIDGSPNFCSEQSLGDKRFNTSSQFNDLLKKIKRENPNSTIEVK